MSTSQWFCIQSETTVMNWHRTILFVKKVQMHFIINQIVAFYAQLKEFSCVGY